MGRGGVPKTRLEISAGGRARIGSSIYIVARGLDLRPSARPSSNALPVAPPVGTNELQRLGMGRIGGCGRGYRGCVCLVERVPQISGKAQVSGEA